MVQPHDASAALLIPSIYRERAWLFAIAALTLCAAALPAWSDAAPENTLETVPQAASTATSSAEVAPSAGSTRVALVKRADAKPQPSSEQQRQFMMLLLMNSAGPVRPFGGLGR